MRSDNNKNEWANHDEEKEEIRKKGMEKMFNVIRRVGKFFFFKDLRGYILMLSCVGSKTCFTFILYENHRH